MSTSGIGAPLGSSWATREALTRSGDGSFAALMGDWFFEAEAVVPESAPGALTGIIFTTRGWTGAEFDFGDGVDGGGLFTIGDPDADLPGDQHNAYDVAVALKAWLEDPARGWDQPLTGVSFGVVANGPRVQFNLAIGLPSLYAAAGNAVWYERMRIEVTVEDGSVAGLTAGVTRGSVSAVPGTVMWDRRDTERGNRTRAGSFRMGHGLYSHRSPSVEVPMSLAQAYAFNEAIQIAAMPRTAYIYDEQSDTMRFVTVGRHTLAPHTDTDVTKVVATLDVLGGL